MVTGAADGYYRMRQRPAGALLHLGPDGRLSAGSVRRRARDRSGRISTLILPANMAWSQDGGPPQTLGQVGDAAAAPTDDGQVRAVADILRKDGARTLLLVAIRLVA